MHPTVDRVVPIQAQILNKKSPSSNAKAKKISSLKPNPILPLYNLKANNKVKTHHAQDIKTFLIHVHKNPISKNILQKNITITQKRTNQKLNFISNKKQKNKKSLILKVFTCINKMKKIYKIVLTIVLRKIINIHILQLIVT